MDEGVTKSREEEIAEVRMSRPHVVILGAGASRAACPNGDKNGNTLPLMNDFTDALGIKSRLEEWGISSNDNFENIYSSLYDQGEGDKVEELKEHVYRYFEQIELPDIPTIYDHLILSLRGKDLIATFNWDPLLMQAYLRNQGVGVTQPNLAFLHGNVSVGYCENDKLACVAQQDCTRCGELLARMPLLYPINQKNYGEDILIRNEWRQLHNGMRQAFMFTVFGYSAPISDQEAIGVMQNAWGDSSRRSMEQTEFITIQDVNEVAEMWDSFIHSHHYDVYNDFYKSWIANHPRRTGEAYISQYIDAKYIEENPLPRNGDFQELWQWCQQLKIYEEQ